MGKWTLQLGKIAGVEFRLHWSVVLALLYIYWLQKPDSLFGFAGFLVFIGVFFGSILLHELGHVLVASLLGIPTRSVTLWCLGGFAVLRHPVRRALHQILIAAAGPLVNFALVVVSLAIAFALSIREYNSLIELLSQQNAIALLAIACMAAFILNGMLGLFNLLPIYPLDGGQMMRAMFQKLLGRQCASLIMLVLGIPMILGLMYLFASWGSWIDMSLGFFLLIGLSTIHPKTHRILNIGLAALQDKTTYYAMRGDYQRALHVCEQQLKRNPRDIRRLIQSAELLIRLEDDQRALMQIDYALALDARSPMPYLARGLLALNRDNYQQAEADFEESCRLDPKGWIPYNNRGCARDMLDNELGALADFQEAMRLEPTCGAAYSNSALIHLRHNRLDSAQAELEQGISLNDSYAEPRLLLAIIHINQQHLDSARDELRQALAISAHDIFSFSDGWHRRNSLCFLEQMLTCYSWAIEDKAHVQLAYCARANLYRVARRFDEALLDYQQAMQYAPQSAKPYIGRALIAMQQADVDRVQYELDLAQAHHPSSAAQRRIAQIQAELTITPSIV